VGNVLVFAEHQKGKFPKSTLIALQAGKEAASKLAMESLKLLLPMTQRSPITSLMLMPQHSNN